MDEFIVKIIENIPKLDNVIDAQIVLKDLYDTEYGIYNHLNRSRKRPLASVAMHEAEDINTGSLLEEVLRIYTQKNIKDIFNLSLLEYLDLPRDIIQMLNTIADETMAKRHSTVDDIEKSIKGEK